MKKILLICLFLVAAGGLFAQEEPQPTFSIGGAVDGIWAPFQMVSRERDITRNDGVDNDTVTEKETVTLIGTGMGRDSGTENVRVRLFMNGKTADEKLGLNVELRFFPAPSTLGFGDQAKVTWDPTANLHFELGKFTNATIRGKIGNNWFKNWTADTYDEDQIFSQFRGEGWYAPSGRSAFGVMASYTISGLYLGLSIPGLANFNVSPQVSSEMATAGGGGLGAKQGKFEVIDFGTGEGEFLSVYQRAHFAIGYTIPDVGLVRLGWVGANATFNPESLINGTGIGTWATPRAEFAFALDMPAPDLTLDIGFKYNLPINAGAVKTWYTDVYELDAEGNRVYEQLDEFKGINTDITDWTFTPPITVSLGTSYGISDSLNISGRLDTTFGGKFENKKAYGVTVTDEAIELPFEINFHAWPRYTFNNGLAAILDIGFAYGGAYTQDGETYAQTRDNPDGWNGGIRFGAGAYIQTVLGQCILRGGVAYSHGGTVHGVKEDMTLSIPIYFEARF